MQRLHHRDRLFVPTEAGRARMPRTRDVLENILLGKRAKEKQALPNNSTNVSAGLDHHDGASKHSRHKQCAHGDHRSRPVQDAGTTISKTLRIRVPSWSLAAASSVWDPVANSVTNANLPAPI